MTKLVWDAIETVLLDMDGTLLDLHFDNYFWQAYLPEQYARQNNICLVEARAHLLAQFAAHQGTLNWYCTDFWSAQLQLPIIQLKHALTHLIEWRPGAEQFLKTMQRIGKRCLLVTNAHPDVLSLKLAHRDLMPYFEHLISAHVYGAPKEDAQFWQALAQECTFDKHSTLLIDDNLAVLRAAARYGIAHLRAVAAPDSQKPAQHTQKFIALTDYRLLYP